LDGRLLHHRYGETVLRAVTGSYERCRNIKETIERLERFFDR
jgi:hypothetical protein